MQAQRSLGRRETFSGWLSGRGGKFTLKELSCELRGSLPADGLLGGGGGQNSAGQEERVPGSQSPWGDEEPGPTPSLGRAPGVHLLTGTSGPIASSEPDCEGLCFF